MLPPQKGSTSSRGLGSLTELGPEVRSLGNSLLGVSINAPPSLSSYRLAVIQVLPSYTSFPETKEPMFHLPVRPQFPRMNSGATPLPQTAPGGASQTQLRRGFPQAFGEVLQHSPLLRPQVLSIRSQLPLGESGQPWHACLELEIQMLSTATSLCDLGKVTSSLQVPLLERTSASPSYLPPLV